MKFRIGDVIKISYNEKSCLCGEISHHKVQVIDITTGHITLYYPELDCKRTMPITMLEGKSVCVKYDEAYLREKIERGMKK